MCRTSQSFKIILIFLWSFLLMLSPCSAQKIKIEKIDGVTIVYNPKDPVKKAGAPPSLDLVQDLCIGDCEDDRFIWGWNTKYELTIHDPERPILS